MDRFEEVATRVQESLMTKTKVIVVAIWGMVMGRRSPTTCGGCSC